MEIQFKNKRVDAYKEAAHMIKRIQESAEAVVPDINEDIGKISSVQTQLFLKSKDMSSRGVLVTGEINATLIYITENEDKVSFVKITKPFSMDFEINNMYPEAVSSINLQIINAESRIVNPRKVSVTVEVMGELSCYMLDSVEIDSQLPDVMPAGFHAKLETSEAVILNCACEKTFALNEQFIFPAGKPAPNQIISQKISYIITETQHIGTKIIVKGNFNIEVSYLSEEISYPATNEFSAPFSQIVDIGSDKSDSASIIIETTSCYLDVIDTISGEKAVDVEIHALIQIVSYSKQKIKFISDGYSNMMPSNCCVKSTEIFTVSEIVKFKLNADERIVVAEECSDILNIYTELCQPTIDKERIKTTVIFDIIYKCKNGSLSSSRRTMNIEGECLSSPSKIIKYRISDLYLRPDGAFIDAHISMELFYLTSNTEELMQVCAIELKEEESYETAKFPSLYLVQTYEESLWQLAKVYHSSLKLIREMNNIDDEIDVVKNTLLLIPKEV